MAKEEDLKVGPMGPPAGCKASVISQSVEGRRLSVECLQSLELHGSPTGVNQYTDPYVHLSGPLNCLSMRAFVSNGSGPLSTDFELILAQFGLNSDTTLP